MKVFRPLILIAFAAYGVLSQTSADAWTTLATKDGAFSVDVPSNFISYKDKARDEVKIIGNRQNSTFSISVRQTKSGKAFLASSRKGFRNDTAKLQSFVVGKYDLDIYTFEKGIDRYNFEIASDSAYYTVSVATRTRNEGDLARFLTSCKLDGKTFMLNSGVVMLDSEKVIYISDLTTSPVFTAAFEHKQTAKIPVVDKTSQDAELPDPTFYSRPLMILRKEFASYTAIARDNSISGEVKLSVVFKGDGDIGEIRVITGLRGGLTESAINSAKRIRFLPAEIDGKPADVTKTIAYGFTIY